MNECLAFYAALAILTAAVLIAARRGRGVAGWLRILSVGVILADLALLLPLPLLSGSGSLALSILGAMQAGSLDASYDEFLAAAGTGAYGRLMAALFVLSPLLLGGMILSFFSGVVWRFRYLTQSFLRDAYYFSGLDSRSMALADSVRAGAGGLVVFSGVTGQNPLREEAKEKGYILYEKALRDFKRFGRRDLYFFLLSEREDGGAGDIRALIRLFAEDGRKERVRIFTFTANPEAEIIMDATDKAGLAVTVVSEPVTTAYHLLFETPLYRAMEATGDRGLSVLVVGAGRVGLELVKAAAWCGQMEGIPLELTAVDLRAGWIERKFRHECPELSAPEYAIRFLEADARTSSLEDALDSFCQNANYIVVSLGDDDLSVKTALFLRGYYLRNSSGFAREPVICVEVSDAARHRTLEELTAINRDRLVAKAWSVSSEQAENYRLTPFGAYRSAYSFDALTRSPLERLAIGVHGAYERVFRPGATDGEILYHYHVNEIGKRSSRANAIHILYKLYVLGFELAPRVCLETKRVRASVQISKDFGRGGRSLAGAQQGRQAQKTRKLGGMTNVIGFQTHSRGDGPEDDAALAKLRAILDDPDRLLRMAEMEHSRWNAFQRSEGYRGVTLEQAEAYSAGVGGSHIHRRARLHACLCGWGALPAVAARFDSEMIRYDMELIRQIPAIVGAEKGARGVGGADYIVRERGAQQ